MPDGTQPNPNLPYMDARLRDQVQLAPKYFIAYIGLVPDESEKGR